MTIPWPVPSTQFVPERTQGEAGFFLPPSLSSLHLSKGSFLRVSDSPVKADSSILIPLLLIMNISAGIISPTTMFTKSPTNKSSDFNSKEDPPLTT